MALIFNSLVLVDRVWGPENIRNSTPLETRVLWWQRTSTCCEFSLQPLSVLSCFYSIHAAQQRLINREELVRGGQWSGWRNALQMVCGDFDPHSSNCPAVPLFCSPSLNKNCQVVINNSGKKTTTTSIAERGRMNWRWLSHASRIICPTGNSNIYWIVLPRRTLQNELIGYRSEWRKWVPARQYECPSTSSPHSRTDWAQGTSTCGSFVLCLNRSVVVVQRLICSPIDAWMFNSAGGHNWKTTGKVLLFRIYYPSEPTGVVLLSCNYKWPISQWVGANGAWVGTTARINKLSQVKYESVDCNHHSYQLVQETPFSFPTLCCGLWLVMELRTSYLAACRLTVHHHLCPTNWICQLREI